jgi:CubicO group peptidase (beta-lactamase class C family)
MRVVKLVVLAIIVLVLCSGVYFAWPLFPIISGFGAKNLCSCAYLSGRTEEDVEKNELHSFPLSLGSFSLDVSDSSASGTVFGFARRKAIYRKGLGCTLVAGIEEESLRAQNIVIKRAGRPGEDIDTMLYQTDAPNSLFEKIDHAKLKTVIQGAFTEPGEEKLRRTRAVVVVYKGRIVAEQYADGYSASTLHPGWSMTKSFNNAVLGLLVKSGKLHPDSRAPVELWKGDARAGITLDHLVHLNSGLKWNESYGGVSDVTDMLYKTADMADYSIQAQLETPPGQAFNYSSGSANIVSKIIKQTLGSGYYDFVYQEVFGKLGMNSVVWEVDPAGTFVASSYSFATARDWARFGLLYCNGGRWNGEQLLTEDWIKYTITPRPAAPVYGAAFWLNAASDPKDRPYTALPNDLFWADGYQGQRLFIIPSQDLVVVKLCQSQGDYLDDNQFVSDIIAVISGGA